MRVQKCLAGSRIDCWGYFAAVYVAVATHKHLLCGSFVSRFLLNNIKNEKKKRWRIQPTRFHFDFCFDSTSPRTPAIKEFLFVNTAKSVNTNDRENKKTRIDHQNILNAQQCGASEKDEYQCAIWVIHKRRKNINIESLFSCSSVSFLKWKHAQLNTQRS